VWPRGISKERACIREWHKELAPSTALRKWFGHDPAKWQGFRERYRAELHRRQQADTLKALAKFSTQKVVTLVYSAVDEEHNQAVVLKGLLDELA